MSDEAPATELELSSGAAPGPPDLTHEMVNVVSAMRIHLFMVRRLLAADPGGAHAFAAGSERWRVEESLDRLESMVDRVVELATSLDEASRAARPDVGTDAGTDAGTDDRAGW
jgi:hypothetical protein